MNSSVILKQSILEKPNDIIHKQFSPTNKSPTNKLFKDEYSLKENVFDPSKSSPPNDFMKNLMRRMNVYTMNDNNLIIK